MGLVDKARIELNCRYHIPYEDTGKSIRVEASSDEGLAVVAAEQAGTPVVSLGEWSRAFGSEREAFVVFVEGLSGNCRLRVDLLGGTPSRWTAERLVENQWVTFGSTGKTFMPFWKSRRVVYRRNSPDKYSANRSDP